MKHWMIALTLFTSLLSACAPGTQPPPSQPTLAPISSSLPSPLPFTSTPTIPLTTSAPSITPLPTIPTFTPTAHPLAISINNTQRLRLIKKISIQDSTSDDSISEITTFRYPDGRNEEYLIAVGYSSGDVRLFNSKNFELVNEFESGPNGIAFSPDGVMLAVANYDSEIRVRNISSGELIQILDFPNNSVENVVFADAGKKIIGESDDGDIRIWDTGSWELSGETRGWFLSVLPPDNTPVTLLLHLPGQQDFIDPITGNVLFSLPLEPPELEPAAFFYETNITSYSSGGKYFAKGNGFGWIAIWDLENRELVNILHGHQSFQHDGPPHGIYDLSFSPFENLLASAGIDGTVRLWDIKTGKTLWVTDFGRSISNLTFSPDGRYLIVGDFNGNIYVLGVSE